MFRISKSIYLDIRNVSEFPIEDFYLIASMSKCCNFDSELHFEQRAKNMSHVIAQLFSHVIIFLFCLTPFHLVAFFG